MVSKNNRYQKELLKSQQLPHFGLRKLGIGVTSVLLGTTFYLGGTSTDVQADATAAATGNIESAQTISTSGTQDSQAVALKTSAAAPASSAVETSATTATSASSSASTQAAGSAKANWTALYQLNAASDSQDSNTASSAAASQTAAVKPAPASFSAPAANPQSASANSPVAANQSAVPASASADEQTEAGQVDVYLLAAGDGRGNDTRPASEQNTPYLTIPFTKDSSTGRYNTINLSDYANQIVNILDEHVLENIGTAQDILFKDQNDHYITTFDPNKLGDKGAHVPVYVFFKNNNELINQDSVTALDNIQKAIDGANLTINGTAFNQKITLPADSGSVYANEIKFWSTVSPDSLINANKYEKQTDSAYPYVGGGLRVTKLSDLNSIFASTHTKVNVKSTDPSEGDTVHYLSLSTAPSSDDQANGIIKFYQDVANANGNLTLSEDDFDNLVGEYGFSELTEEQYEDEYNNAVQQLNSNHVWSTSGNNLFTVMLPEYDSQGKAIANKYAGRLVILGIIDDEETGTPDALRIAYVPLDKSYNGKLDNVYAVSASGSGGGTDGFLTISTNATTGTIKIIDVSDPAKPQTLNSYSLSGEVGDQMDTATAQAQLDNYLKSGQYVAAANNTALNSDNQITAHYFVRQAQDNAINVYITNNEQKATLEIIDEQTGKQITAPDVATSFTATGRPGSAIAFAGSDNAVQQLEKLGYTVVANPTNLPQGTALWTNSATFDSQSDTNGASQNFVIVMKQTPTYHQGKTEKKAVTRTIEYVDQVTGQPIPSKLAPTKVQTSTFTRSQILDADGKIVGYGLLSQDGKSYAAQGWTIDHGWTAVSSPDLTKYGYTAPQPAAVAAQTPTADSQDTTVVVYYGHQHQPISPSQPGNPGQPINPADPTGPKYPAGTDKDSLTTIGTQTVHYVGAGDQTPQDNISHVEFDHSLVIDKVTGKIIQDNGWTPASQSYKTVQTPQVNGYTADQPFAGGETVTQKDPNRNYVVAYRKAANDQAAEVRYLDQDRGNEEVANSGTLTGKANTRINYSTTPTLEKLENEGYVLVNNGFDYMGQAEYFDDNDQVEQIFIVTLKHGKVPVNPDHPLNGVDPSQYEKDVKATVHYVGAGDQTPKDNVQTAKWTRTLTYDTVTKEVVPGQYDTAWTPNKTNYDSVPTPEVAGYTPDQTYVASKPVTMEDQLTVVAYKPANVTAPTQPTNASQPTSVTSPTQPTNASQPTSVTSPTQPTNASQPTSVTSPTQPTNASQPTSVTSPTQPTNASQSTSVTSPTQPTNASQPTSVTSPTQPTNASQPTSVTSPTQPTNASQPTSVTSPTQPTSASQPTGQTQPSGQSQPTSVTSPTQPTNGSQPTSVTQPTAASQSSQTTNASQPTGQTQPSGQSQPTSVTQPTTASQVSQTTSASQPTGQTQPSGQSQPTSATQPTSQPTNASQPTGQTQPSGQSQPTSVTQPTAASQSSAQLQTSQPGATGYQPVENGTGEVPNTNEPSGNPVAEPLANSGLVTVNNAGSPVSTQGNTNSASTAELPQTGNNAGHGAALAGLIGVAAASGLLGLALTKRRE